MTRCFRQTSDPDQPVERFQTLAREVEGAFDAIQERNRGSMACRAGCTDCCRSRLSVTHLEAAFLRRGLTRLSLSIRRELKSRAADATREMCPALDPKGRCQIYASRPIICRSHGAPLRHRHPVSLIQPSILDVCDKNFVGIDLDKLPPRDRIEQIDVMEALASINASYCRAHNLPADERIPIAEILEDCV